MFKVSSAVKIFKVFSSLMEKFLIPLDYKPAKLIVIANRIFKYLLFVCLHLEYLL